MPAGTAPPDLPLGVAAHQRALGRGGEPRVTASRPDTVRALAKHGQERGASRERAPRNEGPCRQPRGVGGCTAE
eukprot:8231659-Alexandrium_andersonii.AAC.1